MERRRILLAEGHPRLLGVLDAFLAAVPQLEIVARARTGPEALAQADRHRPHLVLMSLTLPELSGLDVARRLAAAAWAPGIVLMSFHDEPEYRRAAEAAGAVGFVSKPDLGTKLLPLIGALLQK